MVTCQMRNRLHWGSDAKMHVKGCDVTVHGQRNAC